MKTSPIIMLCGSAGSGKDTTANMIAEIMPKTVLISQAEPLKMLGDSLFGFTKEQLWGPSECRNAPDPRFDRQEQWDLITNEYQSAKNQWLAYCGIAGHMADLQRWIANLYAQTFGQGIQLTPRVMLQTLGTEFGRAINSNIWTDIAMAKSKEKLLSGQASLMLITDGRFKNEVLNTKMHNGMVVLVLDPVVKEVGIIGHASEAELKTIPYYWYDVVIVNNKRLGIDFYKKEMEAFCTKFFKDTF